MHVACLLMLLLQPALPMKRCKLQNSARHACQRPSSEAMGLTTSLICSLQVESQNMSPEAGRERNKSADPFGV